MSTIDINQLADQIEAALKDTGRVCTVCGKVILPRNGDLGEEQETVEVEPIEVPSEEPVPA